MAMPVQQGQQCQHNKCGNPSTIRAMMPAQRGWWCQCNWWWQCDESQCQHDEGNNTDEVVDTAMECGYNYLELLLYANWQHINVLNYIVMSIMDAGSSLRWPSASTLTWLHHFNSTSDQVPQNLSLSQVPYAYGQDINVLKYFVMSEMDAGSSSRWLSASTMRNGANQCGAISNTINLILRLLVYHFLHSMSSWRHGLSTTAQTNNKHHHHGDGAICPSSGVDSMNPRHPSGGRPCTYTIKGRCWRILIDSLK